MIEDTAVVEELGLDVGRVQIASLPPLPIRRGRTVTIRTHQVEEPIPEEVDMEEVRMRAKVQDYPLHLKHRDKAVLDSLWVQDQRDDYLGV